MADAAIEDLDLDIGRAGIAALEGEPGVRVVNGAEALAFFAAMN